MEESFIRNKLMLDKAYSPYCGNDIMTYAEGGCHNPRTKFKEGQFICPSCGWKSQFPTDFIDRYKKKWEIE